MRVLLTRPLRESAELATILARCGHSAIQSPLLDIVALAWDMPHDAVDALVLTSQNAVPQNHLDVLQGMPCFCIGAATAVAARAAGLNVVSHAQGDRAKLIADIAAAKPRHVLFLSGHQERADLIAALAALDIPATKRIVYRADAIAGFSADAHEALVQNNIDWVLLFSPRSAGEFCRHLAQLPTGIAASLRLACLSEAVADVCRANQEADWAQVAVANTPSLQALLAAAGLLCDSVSEYVKDQS
jgi:uroporphyrinogen-III synthase